MHPAVHQGVVLAGLLDLEAHAVGIDLDHRGSRALFTMVDHLRGLPIVSPCIRGHLVVVHGLDSIVKGHDMRGRLGELAPHHP